MKGMAKDLARMLGPRGYSMDPEDLLAYRHDALAYYAQGDPMAVALPGDAAQAAAVLAYASHHDIPLTPRGAGSGLSGGCTPVKGGIVLDTKRLNAIQEINRGNLTAKVQAGVVLAAFQRAVEAQGFFYPPDPQSKSVCTLGGNVATRAGGPRAVKYGTTGSYVLGLEAVLPDGEIIHTGSSCVKHSAGYDLTHLLTGSEGTLALITQATLRLLPKPPATCTALAVCANMEAAARMVSEAIAGGVVPSMLELLTTASFAVFNRVVKPPLPEEGEACLLMEFDGTAQEAQRQAQDMAAACQDLGALEVRVVPDPQEAALYWKVRSQLYPLVVSRFKRLVTEDVTVPRDRIPDFVERVMAIAQEMGLSMGLTGHAGDGNMHPTIRMDEVNDELQQRADQAMRRVIQAGLALGGVISGEHGVGLHKAEFLELELGREQVELMRRIKRAFDPTGIMNPGKIWPSETAS
ncbi:FAD-binding oxidoreductase [Desulfoferula mesophila]|uniref:Glycolate oxidase subunit GlcD n=1 Tax=Desulfoferula mesophila TaxID=3058419 RepID=A0AAU9EJ27_9BACT|nr:glycolate oxidase subunit GlcD [Desulfoferula mesophilus]